MKPMIPSLAPFICIAGMVLAASPLAAQGAPVACDLLEGSFLLNDCPTCDNIPIEHPLAGTFVLTPKTSGLGGEVYELTAIDWHTTGDPLYQVSGQGTYRIVVAKVTTQEMALDLEINGEAGLQLQGNPIEILWPWPVISLEVQEVTASDTRVYHIFVLAAPRPEKTVNYKLRKESTYTECLPCAGPVLPVFLSGKFVMGLVGSNSLFRVWRIDGVDFQDEKGEVKITGSGAYVEGDEVALSQEMLLQTTLKALSLEKDLFTSGGKVPAGDVFPKIQIQVVLRNPDGTTGLHGISVVALPEVGFRRGDPNDDGRLDLSDIVFFLWWQFIDGPAPGCLDAADGDGNGEFDVNDAVYLLSYLFLSGGAPPSPGPETCGLPGSTSLGCASYGSCIAIATGR